MADSNRGMENKLLPNTEGEGVRGIITIKACDIYQNYRDKRQALYRYSITQPVYQPSGKSAMNLIK